MKKVTSTELFRLLVEKEKVDGFEASQISSVVNKIITNCYPIFQQVSRNFPLYTLHDSDHGFRVAENVFRLIPKSTLNSLNSIEISIILYSAFLHDIGMASSSEEFYNWLESESYEQFIYSNEKWGDAIRQLTHNRHRFEEGKRSKAKIQETNSHDVELRRLQDIIYTEYLRLNHAKRGAEFVLSQFGDSGKNEFKISTGQVNYAEYVALVCMSHWDSAKDLKSEIFRRDLHLIHFPVNLQYCAVLLRLADLIDLDPDRTPKVLKEFIFSDINPRMSGNDPIKKSQKLSADEWAKHRSVLGYKISPEEIRIEAKCSHPAIQRGLIEWCEYFNSERRDCRLLVKDNVKEITDKYHLDLVNEIRSDYIKSDDSYIYSDFKFQLDYDRIVNMLMGTELWGDDNVVIRELLQNSVDACNYRKALCIKANVIYNPEIVFSIHYDHENGKTELSCSDNGIGMNQHIIQNYLMYVGRSYYTSNEFKSKNLAIYPISKFGLGIMSYFMITNKVRIETQYMGDAHTKHEPLSVEIDSQGKYVVVRKLKEYREGTKVSLIFDDFDERHLKKHHRMKFLHRREWDYILHHYAVHVNIPIKISSKWGNEKGEHARTIKEREYYIPQIDWSLNPAIKQNHREFIIKYDYEETNGLAGIFRFLIPIDEEGNLTFTTIIDSKFKLCIDRDGDMCFTTANKKDDAFWHDLQPSEDFDWDTDEIRGVYRMKYGQKPPEEYGMLEKIESNFIWSQDGLRVDIVESQFKGKEEEQNKRDKTNIFKFIPVPGLNAAEFDLQGDFRTSLNVQRTDFIKDESFEKFIELYYGLMAKTWLRILSEKGCFKTKKAKSSFVEVLLKLSDWNLQKSLSEEIKEQAKPRGKIKKT